MKPGTAVVLPRLGAYLRIIGTPRLRWWYFEEGTDVIDTVGALQGALADAGPGTQLIGRLPNGEYAKIRLVSATEKDGERTKSVVELHLTQAGQ